MSTAEPQQPAAPVTDDTSRRQLSPAASLEELPAPDVVVIGGSLLDEDPAEPVAHWLHQAHPTTRTTSACTGAIHLAAGSRKAARRTRSTGTPAGMDCPQQDWRERT